jgi:hypothetical protein
MMAGLVRTLTLESMVSSDRLGSRPVTNQPAEAMRARAKFLAGLYKRFSRNLTLGTRRQLYISTLLDPRFKTFEAWPTDDDEYDLEWGLAELRETWVGIRGTQTQSGCATLSFTLRVSV